MQEWKFFFFWTFMASASVLPASKLDLRCTESLFLRAKYDKFTRRRKTLEVYFENGSLFLSRKQSLLLPVMPYRNLLWKYTKSERERVKYWWLENIVTACWHNRKKKHPEIYGDEQKLTVASVFAGHTCLDIHSNRK